ncbi:MAG: hypothetical protein AB7D57_12905 [Desulfovibrionaceae bacterium]
MVDNIISDRSQVFWIIFSSVALLLFSVFLTLHIRSKRPAGSKGHRDAPDDKAEQIGPDGYIDDFAGEIEEAGGGLTPVVWVVLVTVLLWWGGYLILYWKP